MTKLCTSFGNYYYFCTDFWPLPTCLGVPQTLYSHEKLTQNDNRRLHVSVIFLEPKKSLLYYKVYQPGFSSSRKVCV